MEGSKQQFLINLENIVRCNVEGKHVSNHTDKSKKKFITFPYPYMNGRLHLGHAYTILNADMQARYFKQQGYNVLFPFSFHGSGMPIVACAKKLEHELMNDTIEKIQTKILLDMGVQSEDIPNFVEPIFWIKYFSEHTIEDLKQFGVNVDFSRSFYTTSHNALYDSFIQWQFSHLMSDGYLINGKRHVIYSELDGQPCADHDRSVGEGIKPKKLKVIIYEKDGCNYLCTCENDPNYATVPTFSNSTEFVTILVNGVKYCCSKQSMKNIMYQHKDVILCDDIVNMPDTWSGNTNNEFGTGIYISDTNELVEFEYYEPEEVVISRSGDNCIVALTDQIFLNYGNEEVKKEVMAYVTTDFHTPNKVVLNNMIHAVEWLNEWPVSRNYGLGTYIPNTTSLIDSLSDSTIYMALYTIYDTLQTLPLEHVTKNMWDYVFLGTSYDIPPEIFDIVNKMRQEFLYWYPVDIRVSGKDLMHNHLTMALYNHCMIWKTNEYMPISYYVNGYLMLNGKKMSKSTGNFLTMTDAVKKYGADVTRLTLANNDGVDDGDFDEKIANSNVLKLYNEYIWIQEHYSIDSYNEVTMWDIIFENIMRKCYDASRQHYINTEYRSVTLCFNELLTAKNEYIKMMKMCDTNINSATIRTYINTLCYVMYPIIPFFVESVYKILGISNITHVDYVHDVNRKLSYYRDIILSVLAELNSSYEKIKRKGMLDGSTFKVSCYTTFTETELSIINDSSLVDMQKGKKTYGSYKGFLSWIGRKVDKYGDEWFEWIKNDNHEEFVYLTTYVTIMFKGKCEVVQDTPSELSMFKFMPSIPRVSTVVAK
jgi:leucyl-tRNA synthetase